MHRSLRRRLQFLRLYAGASVSVFAVLAIAAFRQPPSSNLGEITVERINVVDKNGTLRLVISNRDRFPMSGTVEGRTFQRQGEPSAGVIFYNDEGVENGGLVFSGKRQDGRARADAGLLFDQYMQDQTVGITYGENDGRRSAGLHVWDRPDAPITELIDQLNAARKLPTERERNAALEKIRSSYPSGHRVFVGKQQDRSAVVMLSDANGKARLSLRVDADGRAAIEFLDEDGKVVQRFTPPAR
jgi:hypothetical protein